MPNPSRLTFEVGPCLMPGGALLRRAEIETAETERPALGAGLTAGAGTGIDV